MTLLRIKQTRSRSAVWSIRSRTLSPYGPSEPSASISSGCDRSSRPAGTWRAHLLSEHAPYHVRRPARRERDNQRDRSCRVSLRPSDAADGRERGSTRQNVAIEYRWADKSGGRDTEFAFLQNNPMQSMPPRREASWGYWGSCAERAARPSRRGGATVVQPTARHRT
jgi:hypothetical protein